MHESDVLMGNFSRLGRWPSPDSSIGMTSTTQRDGVWLARLTQVQAIWSVG